MEYHKHVPHIMWQPTANCALKCPGCYVTKADGPLDIQIALDVFSTKKVSCSQFTLSADTFTQMPKDLKDCIRGIWKRYPDSSLPELCVTANSWNTVQCWARDLDMNVDEFLKPISILSLSTFPTLGKNIAEMIEQCHANDTKVNFNYMVKGGEENSKYFEMGCRYADQVYLVLKKAPLGQPQEAESFSLWLKARRIGQQIAPNKIIEDVCVLDSIHYVHTGQECGAGKKKQHVWPDGKLTGCPYDSNQTGFGMCQCTIPDAIRDLQKPSEEL